MLITKLSRIRKKNQNRTKTKDQNKRVQMPKVYWIYLFLSSLAFSLSFLRPLINIFLSHINYRRKVKINILIDFVNIPVTMIDDEF